MRSPGRVPDFGRRVDAESPKNRGGKVCGCHRVGFRIGSDAVAGSKHLSAVDATSSEDQGIAIGPVVPPRPGVDGWRATEFSGGDHERTLEESAFFQIRQ